MLVLPSETQFIYLSILLIVVDQRKDCNNTHGAKYETNNAVHNANSHVMRQIVLLHAKNVMINKSILQKLSNIIVLQDVLTPRCSSTNCIVTTTYVCPLN